MRARNWTRLLAAVIAYAAFAAPVVAEPSMPEQRGWRKELRSDDRAGRRIPRGYQEPAFARGYDEGYATGLADGRARERYDPVRHKDYRQADQGYSGAYGSKDAYRNNYRAGFRQGYDEGYRNSTR
jgi:hypothetical protein